MKKWLGIIWGFIVLAVLYILYFNKRTSYKDTTLLELKLEKNRKKIKDLKRRRIDDKNFHDLTDNQLTATFDRLRKRYKNKQK
jgi:hypothetical protein